MLSMSLVTRLSRSPRAGGRRSRAAARLSLSSTSARSRYIVRCTTPARMYACSHDQHGRRRRRGRTASSSVRCSAPKSMPLAAGQPLDDEVGRVAEDLRAEHDERHADEREQQDEHEQGQRPDPCGAATAAPIPPKSLRLLHRACAAARMRPLPSPVRSPRGCWTSSSSDPSDMGVRSVSLMPHPEWRSGKPRSRRTWGRSRAAPRAHRDRPARRCRARGSGRR